MSFNWNMNVRFKMFTAKVATAAMATLLLASQTPGFAGSASAATAEQVIKVAAGETEQPLNVTDNEVPEGANISSKQASENILNLFPLLKKAKISSSRFDSPNSFPPPDYKAWDIEFELREGNRSTGFSATVHAGTGEVLSVHLPSELVEKQSSDSQTKLTRTEAKKQADEFLYKAIPNLKEDGFVAVDELYVDQAQQSLFGRTEYTYSYQLKHEGVLSDAETAYISVDQSGLVTGYSRGTIAAEYPSSKAAISADQAQQKFEEEFDIQLAYISEERFSSRKGQKYYLGYMPKNSSVTALDANTLERINNVTGEAIAQDLVKEDKPLKGSVAAFTPNTGQRLNVQQAEKLVQKNFNIPEGYQLDYSQLSKGNVASPNNQVWNLSWSNRNASASYMFMRDISAQVDAATGQIYSVHIYQRMMPGMEQEKQEKPNAEAKGKSVTKSQAEKLAINTVIALIPDAGKQFRLSTVLELEGARTFVFQRYLNGIAVKDDTVQVQVLHDGTINEFYTMIAATPEQLPTDVEPAIRYEKAKATYLEELKLILVYSHYGGFGMGNGESVPVGVKLAYMPTLTGSPLAGLYKVLDANTGEWKSMYGNTGGAVQVPISDITGHADETALQNMVEHGVLLADEQGRVFPDRVITKGDWFTYLARAVNPNMNVYYSGDGEGNLYADITPESPYYQAVRTLIDQRWLADADPESKLNPEEEMTREELAVLLVRILRYEKLAGFYTLPSDLPNLADAGAINNKGAVSLSLKLGLLPSIEGRFMPARKVTVAEAAQVLERLAKLQGKTDTFMNGNRLY
ncbi:YcdB/YcdC domain-containing protein [Paenibacillus sp. QZ-Y1]|uniref:YcdB/YcdC domain-containing protein n=1 Tax=Paenibacillus sp. QZ-Y1 TaxID=3414511 RepID=UPI003F78EB95